MIDGKEELLIESMQYIRELNYLSVFIRVVLAVVCGGIIGMERGIKGRPAGFRTHILVCVGAALMTMTGQYIVLYVAPHADPARLGAQVISGIGFLGVGTIITTGTRRVRGLTTAAGLWTAACLGLSIGIGFYEAAILGSAVVLLAMVTFQKFDQFFYGKRFVKEYSLEIDRLSNIKKVIRCIREHDYYILETLMEQEKGDFGGNVTLMVTVRMEKPQNSEEFQLILEDAPGVLSVDEI